MCQIGIVNRRRLDFGASKVCTLHTWNDMCRPNHKGWARRIVIISLSLARHRRCRNYARTVESRMQRTLLSFHFLRCGAESKQRNTHLSSSCFQFSLYYSIHCIHCIVWASIIIHMHRAFMHTFIHHYDCHGFARKCIALRLWQAATRN